MGALPRPGPPPTGLLGDPSPTLAVGHSGPGRVMATRGTSSAYQGFLHCLSHQPHTRGNSLEGLHNQSIPALSDQHQPGRFHLPSFSSTAPAPSFLSLEVRCGEHSSLPQSLQGTGHARAHGAWAAFTVSQASQSLFPVCKMGKVRRAIPFLLLRLQLALPGPHPPRQLWPQDHWEEVGQAKRGTGLVSLSVPLRAWR